MKSRFHFILGGIAITEFIMFVGLPASGKSTYAGKLKEQGYHIHSSDVIREELTGDVNAQDKNTDVFTVLHKRVKDDLVDGISCVYDATNMCMKRRKAFLDEIKKYNCRKKCVLFVIPVEVCKERNANRERKVPDEVFDKMIKQFDAPMRYEGWDEIEVVLDEEYDYEGEYVKLLQNAEYFEQDNKHHRYSLMKHMTESAHYCIDHFRDIPAGRFASIVIALYNHDIGKLITKTFVNQKGETTDEAHYYGHDHAGAYLFLCGFSKDLFENTDQILYIASLINWHMRPYLGWKESEKARGRDRKLIGEEMYQDIMILNECDRAAH